MGEEHRQGDIHPRTLDALQFLLPGELPTAFAPKQRIPAEAKGGMLFLLAEALDAAFDGIVIVDTSKPHLPLLYANAGFERLTGYTRKEALNQSLGFLHGPGTVQDTMQKKRDAIQRKKPLVLEVLHYRKDGTPYWVNVSVSPLDNPELGGDFCVVIYTEITQRIAVEQQLRETMRLLEVTNLDLTQKTRTMERNLAAAERVQRSMLPTVLPETDRVRFGWRYRPSEMLAGDSLNVYWLDEEHIGIYLLDVTGHGTAAALLAVSVSRMLQPTTSASSIVWKNTKDPMVHKVVPPAEVADQLNRYFPWEPEGGQFFTMIYGVLNIKTYTFRYVSAGHPSPIYVTPHGDIEYQSSNGVPIGLSSRPYEEQTLQLTPGGRLLLYSDGMTDVMNERMELWGQIRLCKALRNNTTLELGESLDDLMLRTDYWSGQEDVKDDRTLIGLEIFRKGIIGSLGSSNFGMNI